jgi:hypothetical protein
MDQSSTRRKRTPVGYLGEGRLMGGRGVIFPGSYRVYKVDPQDWLEATPANFPHEIEIVDYETNESALKARIGIRAGGLKEAPEAIVKKYKDHVLPPSRTTNPVRYFSPEEPVLLNNFE